jgi:restriction endonuclease S subunit
MVSNTKSVSYNKLIEANRIDPRYFFLEDKLIKFKDSNSLELIEIGDQRLKANITDGEHAGQIFLSSGILFIKNSSLKDYEISILDGFYISVEKHKKLKRSALKSEDVLFTTIGHIGSSAIVPEIFEEANINQNLVKIEIDKSFLDPYYFSAFLNSSLVKEQIRCLFTGNIHGILTYPKIRKIVILKPADKIQREIRESYKKAIMLEIESNKLIINAKEEFNKLLEIKEENKQNKNFYTISLSQLKENILTPQFYSPESSSIKFQLSDKYPIKKLGGEMGIAEVNKGNEVGSDNYNIYLEKKDTDLPFIRTSDVYNFQVDSNPDYYVPNEIAVMMNQKILPKDILFTKDGKIGKVAMVTDSDNFFAASGIAIIRANKISPYYLFLSLLSEQVGQIQAKQNTVIASTLPHLRESKLEEFEIPILPKDKVDKLSMGVERAFKMKDEKKKLINSVKKKIEAIIN